MNVHWLQQWPWTCNTLARVKVYSNFLKVLQPCEQIQLEEHHSDPTYKLEYNKPFDGVQLTARSICFFSDVKNGKYGHMEQNNAQLYMYPSITKKANKRPKSQALVNCIGLLWLTMLPLTHHPEVCYGLLLHCGQYLKLAKCIASIHANCGGRYSKVEHASLHATRQPPTIWQGMFRYIDKHDHCLPFVSNKGFSGIHDVRIFILYWGQGRFWGW